MSCHNFCCPFILLVFFLNLSFLRKHFNLQSSITHPQQVSKKGTVSASLVLDSEFLDPQCELQNMLNDMPTQGGGERKNRSTLRNRLFVFKTKWLNQFELNSKWGLKAPSQNPLGNASYGYLFLKLMLAFNIIKKVSLAGVIRRVLWNLFE